MKTLFALALVTLPLSQSVFAQEAAPAKPAEAAPAPAPAPAAKEAPAVPVKNVTPEEAEKLMKETPGIIVLDVRTPEEFDHQHIKGAVNVNVFDLEFEKLIAGLDQTKPVIVHCQAGGRSTQALEEMEGKVKFPQIYHLKSGFKGWKDAKKPFEEKPLPGAGRLAPGKKAADKPAEKPVPKPAE